MFKLLKFINRHPSRDRMNDIRIFLARFDECRRYCVSNANAGLHIPAHTTDDDIVLLGFEYRSESLFQHFRIIVNLRRQVDWILRGSHWSNLLYDRLRRFWKRAKIEARLARLVGQVNAKGTGEC